MGDVEALRRRLREFGRVVVAFSGGADSAFLAWVANDVLGADGALVATAVSASLAPSELDDCRSLAREWDLNYEEVESQEAARPAYLANGPDRCWHCKDELMRCLTPLAASFGAAASGDARVVLGVNVDDLGDYRPGQAAARAAGAAFPSRRGRLYQVRRERDVAFAWPADVGQTGGSLPGVAGALRFAHQPGDPGPGGKGGGRSAHPRFPGVPRAPLRGPGPGRTSRFPTSREPWRPERMSSRPSAPPATAM